MNPQPNKGITDEQYQAITTYFSSPRIFLWCNKEGITAQFIEIEKIKREEPEHAKLAAEYEEVLLAMLLEPC